MNTKYDTIDETYLENKIGLYNVKNIEIIEYITLFAHITHSNNPDKIKLMELFLNLLISYDKIKEFLEYGTTHRALFQNICTLNNDTIINKIISLYKENNLLPILIIDNIISDIGYKTPCNIIIDSLCYLNIKFTDNILIEFSEILDKYYVSNILKNENYNRIIELNTYIFFITRTNRTKFIENIIDIYNKYNILEYLTHICTDPSNLHDPIYKLSIFTCDYIIEKISDNHFEQLINITFLSNDFNYIYLAKHILSCETHNQNDEINERYLILYTKLKDKIGMDNILDILCKYKVSQKLIDYIINNINHDIKKAEI